MVDREVGRQGAVERRSVPAALVVAVAAAAAGAGVAAAVVPGAILPMQTLEVQGLGRNNGARLLDGSCEVG